MYKELMEYAVEMGVELFTLNGVFKDYEKEYEKKRGEKGFTNIDLIKEIFDIPLDESYFTTDESIVNKFLRIACRSERFYEEIFDFFAQALHILSIVRMNPMLSEKRQNDIDTFLNSGEKLLESFNEFYSRIKSFNQQHQFFFECQLRADEQSWLLDHGKFPAVEVGGDARFYPGPPRSREEEYNTKVSEEECEHQGSLIRGRGDAPEKEANSENRRLFELTGILTAPSASGSQDAYRVPVIRIYRLYRPSNPEHGKDELQTDDGGRDVQRDGERGGGRDGQGDEDGAHDGVCGVRPQERELQHGASRDSPEHGRELGSVTDDSHSNEAI